MVLSEAEDPVTGTTWFDSGDMTGTVETWIGAILGIGALLIAFSIAQNTVLPAFNAFFDVIPGVNTGESTGVSFE